MEIRAVRRAFRPRLKSRRKMKVKASASPRRRASGLRLQAEPDRPASIPAMAARANCRANRELGLSRWGSVAAALARVGAMAQREARRKTERATRSRAGPIKVRTVAPRPLL